MVDWREVSAVRNAAACVDDHISVFNIYLGQLTTACCELQGNQCPLLASTISCTYMHIHRHPHIHIVKHRTGLLNELWNHEYGMNCIKSSFPASIWTNLQVNVLICIDSTSNTLFYPSRINLIWTYLILLSIIIFIKLRTLVFLMYVYVSQYFLLHFL